MVLARTQTEKALCQCCQACPSVDTSGKRNRERPKTTWRRSTEAEVKQTGMSWNQLEKRGKGQGQMEISCARPMFQWERKGLREKIFHRNQMLSMLLYINLTLELTTARKG